ncbi:MAG: PH domain-containing protein [Clostridia bacterium]
MEELDYIWKDKKRPFFGLPLSFTTYIITSEKLLIRSGIFNTQEEDIRLYRIMDITLKRSIFERIFNLGTIHCCSADRSTPEFEIKNIRDAFKVKELLSDLIEKVREEKNISSKEFMNSGTVGEF